ncbi:MAG: outer membrane beta-barrel protein [Muribaculaceae bacterium]|nr:outer membrane beta-barrel protein [Muribaculaceae bacterium]
MLFFVAASGLDGNRMAFAQTNAPKKPKTEKVDSIELNGEVYDRMTTRHVPETKIEILRPDSSLISSTKGGWKGMYWRDRIGLIEDSTSKYTVTLPKMEGNYIIRVSKDGYETKYVPYALANLKKRDDVRTAPKIYLSRIKVKNLEEFTVKASKVMFYHKGDTIVYNADAFMLPEGSMLDALIVQMPGVEIKDGGKIYVNGRFVESLLLNGKDFFKGNQNVMLENIGVYAVKDVAVYEKKEDMAAILGERGDVEKEYVMDVRLKKDHMAGNMINAEAGGGTKSRYIGRLFGMHYTNNSRVSLYGNANNINQNNKLTQSEYEYGNYRDFGIMRKINGGIDYFADNALHTWEVAGNVDANYNDRRSNTVTNAINYLQTADNFDFSSVTARARNFSVSTFHNFKIKKNRWNLELKPQFSYNKNRNNNETVAATFNQEIQNLNESIIKAIYSGNYRDLQTALINRNLKIYEADSHGYDAQLQGSSKIKLPDSPDAVELKFTAKYDRKSLFDNTLQDICFGSTPASSLLQNRYQSNRPQYNLKLQGLARYYFNIPFGTLNASYEFIHTQNRKNSDMSLLEAMAENSMAEFVPGELPAPDLANSYTSKFYKNQHILKLTWYYKKKYSNVNWNITIEPKFFLERHDLFYHRGETNADPHRSFVRINIDRARFILKDNKSKWDVYVSYRMQQTAPNLHNMIDIRDTTDPLNVRLGNSDLKNSTRHSLEGIYDHYLSKRLRHNVYLDFQWTDNDFATGYRYDSSTGVRTTRTYNVSGNNYGTLQYSVNYQFGSMDAFYVENSIQGGYRNYVNMIGYDAEPMKQKVSSRSIYEHFRVGCSTEKLSAMVAGGFNLDKSKSDGPMITKNNSGLWGLGTELDAKLPFNFSIGTEFRMMKRFGYVEDSMNTFDYIWNAQLGYSIAKGVWRITLDAKDILNQNKGINYRVSATGRSQTLSTVLPRYLMLTVHYRFYFKPKRK